jgi:hypothetical protein
VARPASGSVRRLGGNWQATVSHLGHQVSVGTFATHHEAHAALANARSDAGVVGLSILQEAERASRLSLSSGGRPALVIEHREVPQAKSGG